MEKAEALHEQLTSSISGFAAVSSFAKPDRLYHLGNLIGSIMLGYLSPLLGWALAIFSDAVARKDEQKLNFWMVVIAIQFVVGTCGGLFASWCVAKSGANIVARARTDVFEVIVANNLAWHELEENSRAKVMRLIIDDCRFLRDATSARIHSQGRFIGAFFGGVSLAMAHCWPVGLVVLACGPLLILGGLLQMIAMHMVTAGQASFILSATFASESILNVRTVLSAGAIPKFVNKYAELLKPAERRTVRFAPLRGLMLGFAFASMFLVGALAQWYMGQVIARDQCDIMEGATAVMASVLGILWGGVFLGEAPNYGVAKLCAQRIYDILHDQHKTREGKVKSKISGHISFKNVTFSYPSRPEVDVMEGFSLDIQPGEFVAVVGKSGSGKSTLAGLLLRLYDINTGSIKIDGVALADYNVQHLRSRIGQVDQMPDLFAASIASNVLYGLNASERANMNEDAQVHSALEMANASKFVATFPDGINTHVGKLGTKLSGGQRQRIAWARLFAQMQDKQILLFDEATSALDTMSEETVMNELENVRGGKTMIMIAHKLNTVRWADRIVVVDGPGCQIVEQGTHAELVEKGGVYAMMLVDQDLSTPRSEKALSEFFKMTVNDSTL